MMLTDKILKKQFEMIGLSYKKHKDILNHPEWYQEYCWTSEQQEKFKNWLIRFLSNPKTKKQFYRNRHFINARYEAELWVLNYGWRICDDNKKINKK